MSSDVDINAVCRSWRLGVKKKFRGIASFEERAQQRFALIEGALFTRRIPLEGWEIRYVDYRDWGDAPVIRDWEPIAVGSQWGQHGPSAEFRCRFTMPEACHGQEVMLRFYVGGDTMLHVNGQAWHGVDPFRHDLWFVDQAEAGTAYELVAETYAHYHAPRKDHAQQFALAELGCLDRAVWEAYWDLLCAAKLLQVPQLDEGLQAFVERELWEAMKLIPAQPADDAALRAAIAAARAHIRATVYASDRFRGQGLMHLVGHSHLDVVFMWQHKEYLRKVGRTHATMLRFMERYPEFRFSQSQAKIYADMERCFPDLFAQVQARVAEGRWEPIGAFWVEPDCNLISGESFVRQIAHGQRFFERAFGRRSRSCWQPDVFGLSWGLVQILADSGIEYFLTSKMVPWNDTNPWTRHTYWWEGLDGSRVLGITPPGHFIGTVDPDMMTAQWRNFSDKATVGETLHIYGWGDGGGGVDVEMIESVRRYADFPGLVPTRTSTAEEAFDAIKAKVLTLDPALVPVHRDEIYLEAHRGSVTTKGRLKQLNRRGEFLLGQTELLNAAAWLTGADYPAEALHGLWTELLNAQFHDAVPGTHIAPVYQDLLQSYAALMTQATSLRDQALKTLVGTGTHLSVFNALGCARSDAMVIPAALIDAGQVATADGRVVPQQGITDLTGAPARLVALGGVAGCAAAGLRVVDADAPQPASGLIVTDTSLENPHLRAAFNARGELVSLFDKDHEREVLWNGQAGNVFEMYEDMPGKYDAWDIVETYRDHPIALDGETSLSIDERGPLRASFLLRRRFHASTLTQRISLAADGRQLEFETLIDWQERQRLLKVAFPVDINAREATYDIAYGNITRPTTVNDPQEQARFEVNAHLWMDVSQHDYGVAILNDGKYGCDIRDRRMRLTLLKGSIHPDPDADREVHHFRYALRPHADGWREAGIIAAALAFNQPHVVIAGTAGEDLAPLFDIRAPGMTLEAVKRSDDGQDVILRLVERHNAAVRGQVICPRPLAGAWRCTVLEEQPSELSWEGSTVSFTARPYQIITLRLRCA